MRYCCCCKNQFLSRLCLLLLLCCVCEVFHIWYWCGVNRVHIPDLRITLIARLHDTDDDDDTTRRSSRRTSLTRSRDNRQIIFLILFNSHNCGAGRLRICLNQYGIDLRFVLDVMILIIGRLSLRGRRHSIEACTLMSNSICLEQLRAVIQLKLKSGHNWTVI